MTFVSSSFKPNNPRYIRELTPKEYEVKMGDTADDVQQADIVIIIGTSLNVYPAAGLLYYAKADAELYLIDPADVNVPYGRCVQVIQKGASEGMRELCKLLEV